MTTIIYCDRSDCVYCSDEECQRTVLMISAVASYSGAFCESVEIKKRDLEKPSQKEIR